MGYAYAELYLTRAIQQPWRGFALLRVLLL